VLFKNSTIVGLNSSTQKQDLTEDQLKLLDATDGSTFRMLKEVDPLVAGKFHPNDTRRIRRALEIFFTTGRKTSELYQEQTKQSGIVPRYNSLTLWIYCDREILNKRLDERVDDMLLNGLEDELHELHEEYRRLEPVDLERGIFQVIGFKQFLPWLTGDVRSKPDCIEQMKIATRRYATRQTKWIQKKLIPMVQDANNKGSNERCEVAVLDSTNLESWQDDVAVRGIEVASEFLKGNFQNDLAAPPGLSSLLAARPSEKSFTTEKWQQFECSKRHRSQNRPSRQNVKSGERDSDSH
jgi:tRNA dimethylallyltransferase